MTRLLRPGLYCFLAVFFWSLPSPSGVLACTDFATAPHSRWQIVVQNGASWLLTPCGERFLSLGVNVLDGGYPSRLFEGHLSYHWGTFYPDLPSWVKTTRERLMTWGFNTAGAWSLEPAQLPMPFIPDLALGQTSRFHWFDPFRPSMAEDMLETARRLVAPYKGSPYRIGYFADNEIGWWYSALFVYYLRQPASNYSKQKLMALLHEHYDHHWERFAQDFLPPPGVTSFAELQQNEGRTQLRVGGTGIHVIRRWTSMVAEHYYRLLRHTLRQADPEALLFTDRLQIYYDPDAVRPMLPYVDAVATNYDVDGHDGRFGRYYFDGLRQLTRNTPVLISEWFFASHENRSGNRNQGHLMTVPTQAERARGVMTAVQGFAKIPQLIGMHWFQYYDHPVGGRPDGEDYNFGLVDLDDRPYETLTETFRQINQRLPALHEESGREVAATVSTTAFAIPAARIDLNDQSLREWPREQAFVPGLQAPSPEVVFGDVYLAWDQTGLYLATVSMDYYDAALLAFGDSFPLEEAFRLDWGIETSTGPQRFAVYIVPPKAFLKQGGQQLTRAHFCRPSPGSCEPVAGATSSYFGYDSPRIMLEIALPWRALGLDGPPAEAQLRMELAATTYHRARWMSWSGMAPTVAMQETTAWHTVRLGKP